MKQYFGWYNVNGTNWTIGIFYQLYKDGTFVIRTNWDGNYPANHNAFELGVAILY
jgi:hypothetical protein